MYINYKNGGVIIELEMSQLLFKQVPMTANESKLMQIGGAQKVTLDTSFLLQ
jgi:hypothetical protein